jgi:hypothetical protein
LIKYHQQKTFTNFLENENWQQRKELKRAKLQIMDCNILLDDRENYANPDVGCGEIHEIRSRLKANILAENNKVIESINNLNEN